jgi:hypothetical protein
MSQGYVYFFQADNTHVKIGQSADPHRRLRTLSHDIGHRLTVIGVMPSADARVEEAAIHRDLAEHRLEGEWFDEAIVPKIETYRSRFLAQLPKPRQVLVQSWVSPELYKALEARAKSERRTIANYVRSELGKIIGIDE